MRSSLPRAAFATAILSLFGSFLSAAPASASSGPTIVRNLNGANSSEPDNLTVVGDKLFFTANDGRHGRELWITDGTKPDTRLVRDIRPGGMGSGPHGLTAVGNMLFFTANDGLRGRELWRSDGTRSGTRILRDLSPGSASSGIAVVTDVDGIAYFIKEDHDVELWTSTGTAAGTRFVTDVDPAYPGYPEGITDAISFGGRFFFSAEDHVNGYRLRISDGTPEGTRIVPGPTAEAANFTAVGDTLFFTAGEDGHGDYGQELWKTDARGLAATFLATVGGASEMVDFKDKAFLTSLQLWKSNGSPAGTKPLENARGWNLRSVGRTLFFAGGINAHGEAPDGVELWATDGTAAGTHLVKDINTHGGGDESSSLPHDLTNVNGRLYFAATRTVSFIGGGGPFGLWTSDGTAAGTHTVTGFKAAGGSGPSDLINLGGTLYFTAVDDAHGRELWSYTP